MRNLFRLGIVGLLSLAMGGVVSFVAAGPASASTACTSAIQSTTVSDNVVVPPGASCLIQSATVTGNLTVGSGASITLVGATIGGSFTSTGAHDIRVGNCLEFGCAASTPTTINGNVYITGTNNVPSFPTKNVICDAAFNGGNVVLQGNSAPFAIGNDSQCFYPGTVHVRGSLVLSSNTAAITVTQTAIGGSLQCTGNAPAPTNGGGNTAAVKTGQCSAF